MKFVKPFATWQHLAANRGRGLLFYFTIRYDKIYLVCSQKLTARQLSLLHIIKQKNYQKINKKPMTIVMINPVQSSKSIMVRRIC